jgi:hypothetical protein
MKKSITYSLLFLISLFYCQCAVAQNNIVKSEMTGAWFNPQRSGEGLLIEILDNDKALVTWYTYNFDRQQVWLIGVGDIVNNKITNIAMTITHGAIFGEDFLAADVIREAWGVVTLEFFDCNSGLLTYNSTVGFGSGETQLSRLTSIQNHGCNDNRKFMLGFTPFPAENSQAGVDTAYQIIDQHADIVAQHFDDGIPWPEMLSQASFAALPAAVQADWNFRKSHSKTDKKIYLAITPIAISRDQLAPYKGEQPDIPLTAIGEPWASASFDHADVIQAYKNYAQTAIEFFDPDFLCIGIEVNLLSLNTPEKWQSYVNLNRQTYLYLHDKYPSLPIFVSVFANDYYPGITEADHQQQKSQFNDIAPYTDYLALSVYPYISGLLTDNVPTDYFKVMDEISDKPIAIAESGYMAEPISIHFGENQVINYQGSEQKQLDWIRFLLQQAQQRDFRFVINFINKDYDVLCQQLNCADILRLWEDTGLVDENDRPRMALSVWDDYLARELNK